MQQLQKITYGFVIQRWDANTKKFIGQEFTAGDQCDYVDEDGNAIEPDLIPEYHPFDMSSLTKQDLENEREHIQHELLSHLMGMEDDVLDRVCELVVERFAILISKLVSIPSSSEHVYGRGYFE